MNHTPGPWEVDIHFKEDDCDLYELSIHDSANRDEIAILSTETGGELAILSTHFNSSITNEDLKRKVLDANARLIAAAPELLSMVQEFIFTLQDEHGSYYVDGNIIKGKALWEKASGETWKDEELEEDDDEVEVKGEQP